MTDGPLRRVAYVSRSTVADFEAEAVFHSIAMGARTANRSRDIVALLFFDAGRFFQMIEGRDDAVQDLLARISLDRRHSDMEILEDRYISGRQFGPEPLYAYYLADRAFDANPLLMRRRAAHRKLFSEARGEGRDLVEAARSMMAAFEDLAL